MSKKEIVRKSRVIRKTFGFVEAIQVTKLIEDRDEYKLFDYCKAHNIAWATKTTGHCPSDEGAEGFTVFYNKTNGKYSVINFCCTGYYLDNNKNNNQEDEDIDLLLESIKNEIASMTCDECGKIDESVDCYAEADNVTDEFMGYVHLCKFCIESHEENSGTVVYKE